MIVNKPNPWAGLASYEDPEKAEYKLKFCGRDDDSYDVAKLIMGNTFVTLYGKSGIGKTSLLNAGVFPELREEQYTPLSIRLGMRDEDNPKSYQSVIIESIERSVGRVETVEVIAEQKDEQAPDYLWNYFARHRFYDRCDEPTTPVVVMDQFEEVFRAHRDEVEALLRQLDFLNDRDHTLDNCTINGQAYRYEHHFRFVASIREDDLYRLEDSIDNCYVPALKRCRYRLRSLSEQGARDAILIPGKGLFLSEEQDEVVKAIIEKSKNADGTISTNIISLLCSRIFSDFQSSKADLITKALVDSFIKGNPFEQFYNEATRGFSNREKSYIEDHLVDSTGRRNSIPEGDFLRYVKKGAVLMEGSRRILQRTNTSSDGGNYRIELIHDSFCAPLEEQKGKRRQRRKIRLSVMSLVVFLCVLGCLWLYVNQMVNANNKLKENEILNAVKKSQMAMNNGDSYGARLILLDVIPDNLSECSPAVEEALRTAASHESTVLVGHTAAAEWACFSPDENKIISTSYDNTIKIWDTKTGLCEKTFTGHTGWVWAAFFCPDGKTIISSSMDEKIKIWDIETQKVIKEFDGNGIDYSPNKKKLLMSVKDSIKILDAKDYRCLMEFNIRGGGNCIWFDDDHIVIEQENHFRKQNVVTGHSVPLMKEEGRAVLVNMAVDAKRTKIATAFGYQTGDQPGYLKIWDAQTGKCLHTLSSNEDWVNGVCFSPDGKILASTSMGGKVMLWDANNGACIGILKGHPFASSGPNFSKDGSKLITNSADCTIRIWDIDNGRDSVEIVKDTKNRCYHYVSYSPDGKQFLLVSVDSICLFDSNTKQRIKTLEKKDTVNVASFSPMGDCIAAAFSDRSIGIMSLATGEWKRYRGHENFITHISFSKDGKYVISSSDDQTVRCWDVTSGKCMHVVRSSAEVQNAYYINNKHIIFETADSMVTVWDLAADKCVSSWRHPKETSFGFLLNLSPDGKYYMTVERNIAKIWEIETGECVSTLQGHTSWIFSSAFSPDGKYLVTTSHDTFVKVWDWRSGVCVFSKSIGQYSSSCFSPDGRHIALARNMLETRIIDFPPLKEIVDETRTRFKNRLKSPEK